MQRIIRLIREVRKCIEIVAKIEFRVLSFGFIKVCSHNVDCVSLVDDIVANQDGQIFWNVDDLFEAINPRENLLIAASKNAKRFEWAQWVFVYCDIREHFSRSAREIWEEKLKDVRLVNGEFKKWKWTLEKVGIFLYIPFKRANFFRENCRIRPSIIGKTEWISCSRGRWKGDPPADMIINPFSSS